MNNISRYPKKFINGINIITYSTANNLRRIFNQDRIGCIRYSVTWRCNSRCESCDIWNKATGDKDLTVEEVEQLCKSPLLKHVKRVVLSGGEPTLRDDFPELVTVMHRNLPKARFSVTLNGLLPERTAEMLRKITKVNPNIVINNIGISLNGPKEIHDKSRGVPGSFDRAIETYHLIKDVATVKFSFTFLPYNTEFFKWTQEYAKKLGTKTYLCWTVMNDRFDMQNKNLNFFKEGIQEHLREYLKNTHVYNRLALSYLYDNFIHEKFMQCYAARQFFHLDPEGNIYPCNFKLSEDRIIGNIRKQSFEEIWNNSSKKRMLEEIDCGQCIYQNGPCGDSDLTYSNRNNPLTLLKWYIGKRIRLKKMIE
ncbi:MAG: radical SAM protein [Planctomycetota bacterium]|jgi:radical SAM protein with 4Fe4S-binding SPASM domain